MSDLFVSNVQRISSKLCQLCNSKESVKTLAAKHIMAYRTVLFNRYMCLLWCCTPTYRENFRALPIEANLWG